jgi:hypothetical protein
MTIITSNVLRSDTEPTLIALVEIKPGHLGDAAFQVCDQLGQDCIAVVETETREGSLIGPRAAAWGTFNPSYFLTMSGRRLDQHRHEVPADQYQGHLPGSGVQAHSAGGLYPYVIWARQVGEHVRYGFTTPAGDNSGHFPGYDAACKAALAHKEAAPLRKALQARADAFIAGAKVAMEAARVELAKADKAVREAEVEERCLLCNFPTPERANHPRDNWATRDLPEIDAWHAR